MKVELAITANQTIAQVDLRIQLNSTLEIEVIFEKRLTQINFELLWYERFDQVGV